MLHTSQGPAALPHLSCCDNTGPRLLSRSPTSPLYAELSASTASCRSGRDAQPPGWPGWRSSGRSGATGSQSGSSLPGGTESCRVRRAAGARMRGGDDGGACVRACVRRVLHLARDGGRADGRGRASGGESGQAHCVREPQAGHQRMSHAGSRCRWGTSCPGSGPSTACRPGRCSGGTATQAGRGAAVGIKADALGLAQRSSTRTAPPPARSI